MEGCIARTANPIRKKVGDERLDDRIENVRRSDPLRNRQRALSDFLHERSQRGCLHSPFSTCTSIQEESFSLVFLRVVHQPPRLSEADRYASHPAIAAIEGRGLRISECAGHGSQLCVWKSRVDEYESLRSNYYLAVCAYCTLLPRCPVLDTHRVNGMAWETGSKVSDKEDAIPSWWIGRSIRKLCSNCLFLSARLLAPRRRHWVS